MNTPACERRRQLFAAGGGDLAPARDAELRARSRRADVVARRVSRILTWGDGPPTADARRRLISAVSLLVAASGARPLHGCRLRARARRAVRASSQRDGSVARSMHLAAYSLPMIALTVRKSSGGRRGVEQSALAVRAVSEGR